MTASIEILLLSRGRAALRPWRSSQHGDAYVVVCKRSYALEAGEVALSDQQPPLAESDILSPNGALLAPTDFAPQKRLVDVLLTGRAYAPRGTSANRLSCFLVVGDLEKNFEVHAERYVDLDGLLRDEARFTAAPLGWDQAAGGPDSPNPVGMGWRRDERGRLHLPKLQPVAFDPSAPGWQVPTVGLGPVASTWPERARHLARHGAVTAEALLESGLPSDFDLGYFQVAPADQRLTRIDREASIILGNLHPAAERVLVKLAGEWARCILEPTGRELDMVLDTIAIDTERLLLTLTWRASFYTRELPGVRNARIVIEERGQRRTLDEIRALPPMTDPAEIEDPASNGEALPFLGQKPRSVAVLGQSQIGTRASPESLAGTPFIRADTDAPAVSVRPPRNARTMSMKIEELGEAEPAFLRASGRASTVANAPAGSSQGVTFGRPQEPAQSSPPPQIVTAPPPVPSVAAPREPSRPPPPAPPVAPMSNSSSYGPPAVVLPAAPAAQAAPAAAAPPAIVAPAMASPPPFTAASQSPAPFPAASQSPAPFNTAELAARAKPPSYLLGSQPLSASSGPAHAPSSAHAGVVAASDAAARVESTSPTNGSSSTTARHSAEPVRAPRGPGFLDLLWWHPEAHERLRRSPKWSKIIRLPPSKGAWLGDDDGDARSKEPPERIVARALARGECLSAAGVAREVLESVDDDGLLVRPLVVVEGEVQLSFDPRDTLEATLSFAEPTLNRDAKIKEAYDAASELLKSERKVTLPMFEAATKRVRQAFASSTTRAFAPDYLEVTVERWLLDERRFHKRTLLGETRLISAITPQGSSGSLPLYLPAELENHVPTLPRFKVRVLAEPHGRQDSAESESTSLLALGFARVVGR